MKYNFSVLSLAFLTLFLLSTAASAKNIDVVCDAYIYKSKPKKNLFYSNSPRFLLNSLVYLNAVNLHRGKNYLKIDTENECITMTSSGTICEGNRTQFSYKNKFNAEIIIFESADYKISINRKTGFYSRYLLHTDGSIEGLPLGEPYHGEFGYCYKPETKF